MRLKKNIKKLHAKNSVGIETTDWRDNDSVWITPSSGIVSSEDTHDEQWADDKVGKYDFENSIRVNTSYGSFGFPSKITKEQLYNTEKVLDFILQNPLPFTENIQLYFKGKDVVMFSMDEKVSVIMGEIRRNTNIVSSVRASLAPDDTTTMSYVEEFPMEVKAFVEQSKAKGEPYGVGAEQAKINISDLTTDESYKDADKVQSMADSISEKGMEYTPVNVVHFEGKNYIYDGNHRVRALELLGEKQVNCLVEHVLEAEELEMSDEVDSDGNELTVGQAEFFKNSEIRNSAGRLMKCYHGTSAHFDTFSKTKIGSSAGVPFYGSDFYFTDTSKGAEAWGTNILEVYLNITKPYIAVKDELIGESEQEALLGDGYDGVVVETDDGLTIVAFEPNQIKLTTNTEPTELESMKAWGDLSSDKYFCMDCGEYGYTEDFVSGSDYHPYGDGYAEESWTEAVCSSCGSSELVDYDDDLDYMWHLVDEAKKYIKLIESSGSKEQRDKLDELYEKYTDDLWELEYDELDDMADTLSAITGRKRASSRVDQWTTQRPARMMAKTGKKKLKDMTLTDYLRYTSKKDRGLMDGVQIDRGGRKVTRRSWLS